MSKIKFIILLLMFSLVSYAQVEYSGKIESQNKYSQGFVVGLNANILLPFGNLTYTYGPGFGGGVTAKYIIGGVFGIGAFFNYQLLAQSAQYVGYANTTHTLMNLGVSGEYYLNVGSRIVPYFGLDIARYIFVDHAVYGPGYTVSTENAYLSAFGLGPTVGFVFQINKYIDSNVNFKYNHIFSSGYASSQLVSISVGLVFHLTSE